MMKEKNTRPGRQPANPVRDHFENWPFPGLSFEGQEGLILLRYLHNLLDGNAPVEKKVIDVGCGTGHGTIAIARHFPDVHFTGLDLSTASVRQANRMADEHGLNNVIFRHADILDQRSLPSGLFGLVISFGVLHHIENIRMAFGNLTGLVENNGTVILWLYGRYGRTRHNLNQAFIDMMSRNGSWDERERIAREFVSRLGGRYAAGTGFYTPHGSGAEGLNWLLEHPHWLADQMIPAYEYRYTMKEILDLFRGHGIAFKKWLGVSTRLESYTSSSLLCEKFNNLGTEEQLIAIDHLLKPEYYFVSGQKRSRAET